MPTAKKKAASKGPDSGAARIVRATVPPDDENFAVRLPFDVRAVFGAARPRVVIQVGEHSFRSTVMVYGGQYYVGLSRAHRRAAKLGAGQKVALSISADTAPRTVDIPPDLARALRGKAALRAAWDALSLTYRREHAEAITGAKKPETRARRVDKTLAMLAGGAKRT
jgi:Bacteriocin-protection, YdeI or OmpD-Associated/Domain of unknown function (DUF1905)